VRLFNTIVVSLTFSMTSVEPRNSRGGEKQRVTARVRLRDSDVGDLALWKSLG